MEDREIVALYWARSEDAIEESAKKYGGYLTKIAQNILNDAGEAEESVNDTYLGAWNAMPPHRPNILSTFLGKMTRRISIDRWRKRHAGKRGGGELTLALEELSDCVTDGNSVEDELEKRELAERFQCFLNTLPETERRVFLSRYWYLEPVRDIARRLGFSESKVSSMLYRTRQKLRIALAKEGR